MNDLGTYEYRAWFLVLVIGFPGIRPGFRSHSEILRDFYALEKCSEHSLTQYDQKQIHNIIQESPQQRPVKLLKTGPRRLKRM